jgi:predicted  nucleic acid-binding Zn-ribbon protein
MATIDTLQKKKEEVDKIVNDITLKLKTIEERIVQANNFLNSVKTTDKEFKKLVKTLQQIQKTINENVESFRIEKNKISNLHSEVQKFYNSKFLPLVEKIENTETGFQAKIKQVNATSKNINSISDSCKLQLKKIKDYADRYTQTLKSLESLEGSIKNIYTKVKSDNVKSNEFLDAIQKAKNNSERLAREISTLQQNSVKFEKDIENLLQKAKEKYNEIGSIKVKSEKILEEISNIYEIAADTGRSGEFDKQRKALTLELIKWERLVTISTTILFIAIIGLFAWQLFLSDWNLNNLTMDLSFYCRFIFTSPIIFYVTFVAMQYGKTKKLADIYSYKTTMAMSIKSHLELLTTNESFKKYDKEILQFTLESFEKIHKEPYGNNEDLKMQLKMLGIELDFEKKLKEVLTKTEKIVNDKTK